MQLPQDFKEFIELLNFHSVQYVMIGGWVSAEEVHAEFYCFFFSIRAGDCEKGEGR